MRTRLAGAVIGCGILVWGAWVILCCPTAVETYSEAGREPRLSPDYSGIIIPANIAPLNFRVLEDGCEYSVEIPACPGKGLGLSRAG